MLTVHLAGLIYFDACKVKERQALVPDGTKGDMGLPPHYTSIWVDANRYESDEWWPDQKFSHTVEVTESDGTLNNVFVHEFRIPEPSTVTFPDDKDPFEAISFEETMPRLQDAPGFKLDEKNPETIATIPLRGGTLEPRSFCEVAVVQWSIRNDPDVVTITATTRSGAVKTLKLRSYQALLDAQPAREPNDALRELGIEVLVTNGPDQIAGRNRVGQASCAACAAQAAHTHDGHSHDGQSHDDAHGETAHRHGNHFKLYGKLDVNRNGDQLVDPSLRAKLLRLGEGRRPLDFNHGFLRFLLSGNELPNGECTGSCC